MKTFLMSLITALVTALIVAQWAGGGSAADSKLNRAYDRVMSTRTLKCAYAMWPPYAFIKDPNTGAFSGFVPDYLAVMAKNLNIKIEFTEETGYGAQAIEGLKAGRFDAFCTGMNINAPRGQHVMYTREIFYSPIYAYARANDHRFDKDLTVLNDKQYTLSIMDGEATDAVAKSNFPNAKVFSLPQNSEMSLLYSNVAQGKADVLFSDVPMSVGYMDNNPGKLRRVNDTAVLTYTIGIPVSNDEPKLKAMLDAALTELVANGYIKHVLTQYDPTHGYFAPDLPYTNQ